MTDNTAVLRRAAAAATDGTDQLAVPQDRAEAAYDLSALLNTLDARIGSQLAGAESVGVDSLLEVSRVVRLAARTQHVNSATTCWAAAAVSAPDGA